MSEDSTIIETDDIESVLEILHSSSLVCFAIDSETIQSLIDGVDREHKPNKVLIRDYVGTSANIVGFIWNKASSVWQGSRIFPDTVDSALSEYGLDAISGKSVHDACELWRKVFMLQFELIESLCGVAPGFSLSSTAVKAAIPQDWQTGARYFMRKNDIYRGIDAARYGGRIQMFCETGHTCNAIEYDLVSAYGWALTQRLPDWQVYERRIRVNEPGWYDCEVSLDGWVGPLPVRDGDKIAYPIETTVRGWYTREDLQRSRGIVVKKIYREIAGRYSRDLSVAVGNWLEQRDKSVDKIVRSTLRALCVGLYGKLAQRDTSWNLWHTSNGNPPLGSRPLGYHLDSSWFVFPSNSQYPPLTIPTTASYVTALVRSKVWPYIHDGLALYTNTDSVHLDINHHNHPKTGNSAGDWIVKDYGFAYYHGVNHYRIGNKKVLPPILG